MTDPSLVRAALAGLALSLLAGCAGSPANEKAGSVAAGSLTVSEKPWPSVRSNQLSSYRNSVMVWPRTSCNSRPSPPLSRLPAY